MRSRWQPARMTRLVTPRRPDPTPLSGEPVNTGWV
jgi:hypothetical protein